MGGEENLTLRILIQYTRVKETKKKTKNLLRAMLVIFIFSPSLNSQIAPPPISLISKCAPAFQTKQYSVAY